MKKKNLLLAIIVFTIGILTACSDTKDSIPTGNNPDEKDTGIIVTILDIRKDPVEEWFSRNTVLVETERGKAVFNHLDLRELDVSVGDTVRIYTAETWLETDPAQIDVIDWDYAN